jgi:hypothetical protein
MLVPKLVISSIGLAILAASSMVILNDDALIRHALATAAAQQPGGLPALDETVSQRASEDGYWLSRADAETPSPWPTMATIGDRITITGADHVTRELLVEDVKTLSTGLPALATDTEGPTLLVVSARVLGSDPARIVRFLIDQAAPPVPPAPAATGRRAL